MVRCITWSDDEETFKNERRKEVWQSPPFFMEMRKGDMEDHALLMCNLFLGLGLDAYVCVGRLEGAKELEKRHVWVMTREKGGEVRMWETSTGEATTLPDRCARSTAAPLPLTVSLLPSPPSLSRPLSRPLSTPPPAPLSWTRPLPPPPPSPSPRQLDTLSADGRDRRRPEGAGLGPEERIGLLDRQDARHR